MSSIKELFEEQESKQHEQHLKDQERQKFRNLARLYSKHDDIWPIYNHIVRQSRTLDGELDSRLDQIYKDHSTKPDHIYKPTDKKLPLGQFARLEQDTITRWYDPNYEIYINSAPMLIKNDNPNVLLHELYARYYDKKEEEKDIDDRYPLFVELTRQQFDNGDDQEQECESSVVDGSLWTPEEKTAFFIALERCGRRNIVDISRRIGTKSIVEVASYIDILDKAAKEAQPEIDWSDGKYAAREMSTLFMLQEELLAMDLTRRLETESFAKHLEIQKSNQLVQKAMELFEVWNISSLTRLFSFTNEMVVLSSTLVNMYELLKRFIRDIMKNLYTEMLGTGKDTVDRELMNHVIAKRERLWTDIHGERDVRLKEMDIMILLERSQERAAFSYTKSASYLAKRRRIDWETERADIMKPARKKGKIKDESDSELEYSEDDMDKEEDQDMEEDQDIKEDGFMEEFQDLDEEDKDDSFSEEDDQDSEEDDMLKPFDKEDDLRGRYFDIDAIANFDEESKETENIEGVSEDEDDEVEEEENELIDEKDEDEMKRLDKEYEAKLMKLLGMYDSKALSL